MPGGPLVCWEAAATVLQQAGASVGHVLTNMPLSPLVDGAIPPRTAQHQQQGNEDSWHTASYLFTRCPCSLSAPPKGCSASLVPCAAAGRKAAPRPSPRRRQHLLPSARLRELSPCCVFKAFISQGCKLSVVSLSPQQGSGPSYVNS